MAKILGLDLGTNSIGWAVVEITYVNVKEIYTLIDKGVVIFKEGINKDNGVESSKAAARTAFRSARRLKYRKKIRKYRTLLVLAENKMCPLSIEEVKNWEKSNFKKYPKNKEFRTWLQTGEKKSDEKIKRNEDVTKNPYFLRDKFSRQKYEWENEQEIKLQLGRVFYHIAQRRGFKSNKLDQTDDAIIEQRKNEIKEIVNTSEQRTELYQNIEEYFTNLDIPKKANDRNATEKALQKFYNFIIIAIKNEKNEKKFENYKNVLTEIFKYLDKKENLGPVKTKIADLTDKIGDKTLGQYFWELYKKDRNNNDNKIRGLYTAREEHYENEFNEICKIQKLDNIKQELYDAIFYQRPLKSQKGLVGKCSFETNKYRCSVSHPVFEEFRMWTFLNNMKIKTEADDKLRFLTHVEKEKLIPKFNRVGKAHFNFKDLKKTLGESHYYKYKDNETVSGNPTSTALKSIFGKDWKQNIYDVYTDKVIRNKNNEKKPETKTIDDVINDVWHALFLFDENKLKNFAIEKLKLDREKAEKFSKINLKKDYASLSIKAIKKILPYLKQGMQYNHAVFAANLHKVIDKEIWNDENKRDIIISEIKEIINKHGEETRHQYVINSLLSNCISKETKEYNGYSEESEEYYIDDLNKQFEKEYGNKTWNSLENKKQILTDSFKIFVEQFEAEKYLKIERIDDKIETLLTEKKYCTNKNLLKKLFHPSDIQKFKTTQHEVKDSNGNLIKTIEILGSPKTPSIKNPVAMKSLHQVRKLINSLILQGIVDKKTKINIELVREINDANKRKAIKRYQDERKDYKIACSKKIQELYKKETGETINPSDTDIDKIQMALEQREDGRLVSKEDILKYELWNEQKHICLYTGNTINLTSFLGASPQYDIEHTIPRSVSLDNSQMNKTLCELNFNRKVKGNKMPTELGDDKMAEILPRIAHWKTEYEKLDDEIKVILRKTKIAAPDKKDKLIQERHYKKMHYNYWKGKYDRFTKEEITEGFKNSQKTDIGIISKYAQAFLKSYFKKIYSIKGEMTAAFRKAWGVNKTITDENGVEQKDRTKHIHHAVDAVTLACISKRKYDEIAKAWDEEDKGNYNKKKEILKKSKPWKKFTEEVTEFINNTLINHQFEDNTLKQTKQKIRKRGKIDHRKEYEKNTNGEYIRNENNEKIFKSYVYEKDKITGNRIPVFGKKLSAAEILNKKEGVDYFVVKLKSGNINYEFVRYGRDKDDNKKGEIVYKKEARYQQNNDKIKSTFRNQLHKATYIGAIKKTLKDENGKIKIDENGKMIFEKNAKTVGNVFFRQRKEISKLSKKDIRNIVDDDIKKIFEDAIKNKIISFKKVKDKQMLVINKNETLWQNKELKIPIKKVRVFIDANAPLEIKKHRDKSKESHKYKENIYAFNEGTFAIGLYRKKVKGKAKGEKELINYFEIGKLLIEKWDTNDIFPDYIDKKVGKQIIQIPFVCSIKKGMKVILLKSEETKKDVNFNDIEWISKRLYIIRGIDTEASGIKLYHHMEARSTTDVAIHMRNIENALNIKEKKLDKKEKIKISKLDVKGGGDSIIDKYEDYPFVKFSPTQFNALIEGIDFKITDWGEILDLRNKN